MMMNEVKKEHDVGGEIRGIELMIDMDFFRKRSNDIRYVVMRSFDLWRLGEGNC